MVVAGYVVHMTAVGVSNFKNVIQVVFFGSLILFPGRLESVTANLLNSHLYLDRIANEPHRRYILLALYTHGNVSANIVVLRDVYIYKQVLIVFLDGEWVHPLFSTQINTRMRVFFCGCIDI